MSIGRVSSGRGGGGTPRRAVLGALAAAGSLGATALDAPRAAAQDSVVQDELRVVGGEIFYGLDPVHEFSAGYLRSVGAAEGLLRITPGGEAEADLARAFVMVDPSTWHVYLRPEVTFWSGRPVDAPAVVASLERARALAPNAATLLNGIRAEPVDEWTVQLQADGYIPGLPLILADSWLVVHNAAAYGPQDNSYDLGAADLTGFYRITALEPRVRATLERNERYWGVRPRMVRIRYDEIGDGEARALVALSGEAHMVRSIAPAAANAVERSRTMQLVSVPGTSATNAYFNLQRPPLDDVRVRQALAWAVDKEELVALALDGRGVPLPSWLAANPLYPEARRVGYTRYDATRAGQLLDEAGWRLPTGGKVRVKDGQPLRFRVYWFGTRRPLAEVLQEQWRRVGAEVEVQGANDYGFYQTKRAQNDWDVFVEGWGTFGDPAAVLSRHVAPDGDLNYMRFRDAQIESLLGGFPGLLDPEARRQQALKINERHAELVPFLPLHSGISATAVSRKIRSFEPNPFLADQPVSPDLWVST